MKRRKETEEYPWWFVGAAKRECPIWDAIPIIDGHAIFDMWLLNFRRIYEIIDFVPPSWNLRTYFLL